MRPIIRSEAGFAMMAMTFVAAMIVALMIFMANEAYKTSAEARSRSKEQLAAMDLMKDIGILIRRAYDVGQAKRNGVDCAAAEYRRITISSNNLGTVQPRELCMPRGDKSCISHPMDPDPLGRLTSFAGRPKICFDSSATFGSQQNVNLAFHLDPSQSNEYWQKKYAEWGIDEESFGKSFLRAMSAELDLLPRAYAQNVTAREWFPTVAELNVGNVTRNVVAEPAYTRRTCSNIRTLCVTYSVCLRIGGCSSDPARRRDQEFSQTVGLDRND